MKPSMPPQSPQKNWQLITIGIPISVPPPPSRLELGLKLGRLQCAMQCARRAIGRRLMGSFMDAVRSISRARGRAGHRAQAKVAAGDDELSELDASGMLLLR